MAIPIPVGVAQNYACGSCSTSGDNEIIAAPGSGKQIVIASVVLQNESTTPTLMILKAGSTAVLRCLGVNQGDGVSLIYATRNGIEVAENTAVNVNLDGANQCGYTIMYYILD